MPKIADTAPNFANMKGSNTDILRDNFQNFPRELWAFAVNRTTVAVFHCLSQNEHRKSVIILINIL